MAMLPQVEGKKMVTFSKNDTNRPELERFQRSGDIPVWGVFPWAEHRIYEVIFQIWERLYSHSGDSYCSSWNGVRDWMQWVDTVQIPVHPPVSTKRKEVLKRKGTRLESSCQMPTTTKLYIYNFWLQDINDQRQIIHQKSFHNDFDEELFMKRPNMILRITDLYYLLQFLVETALVCQGT